MTDYVKIVKKFGQVDTNQRFLFFKQDKIKFYTWNIDHGWWLDENGNGFDFETVQKYPSRFVTFESAEDAETFCFLLKHEKKHGPWNKEYYDFACTDCGFRYQFKNGFDDDGNELSTPCDGEENHVDCWCGRKIKVTAHVVVEFEVK